MTLMVLTGKKETNMDFIKVSCITGNDYQAYELSHQRELPKGSNLYECGQEFCNGSLGRTFTLYKKYMKKGNKMYVIFSKYF